MNEIEAARYQYLAKEYNKLKAEVAERDELKKQVSELQDRITELEGLPLHS